MEDDVIARLYPYNDSKKRASNVIKQNPRYAPALIRPSDDRQQQSRRERESTESPETDHASAFDYLPSLAVRFSDVPPRTDKGLVFGSNPNCDVVIKYKGVSNAHFSLTFDDYSRPIIQDLGSSGGTEVTYDNQGKGLRTNFRWIISGEAIPQKIDCIVITIPGSVSFQIMAPVHDMTSPAYIENVSRFKQGAATAESLLYDLSLSNPPTTLGTGANTPGTEQIHLSKKLGEGSFGVVTHFWNVSTAEEHVVKAPTVKAIRKNQFNEKAWRREADIMAHISHAHIVRFIGSSFTPHPRLKMEYVPGGSLEDREDISYNETLTILRQCLSALVYLHGLDPPIAHRDIKPANILVQYRHDDNIYVKLGDFGLSKNNAELMTICGTRRYLAPEVYSEAQRCVGNMTRLGYTMAVDIWSLGVVGGELVCGLPDYEDQYSDGGTVWGEKIIAWFQAALQPRLSHLGQCLLRTMVVLDPTQRCSANDCGDALGNLSIAPPRGLTPGQYPDEEDGQPTFRHALRDDGAEDLSTIVYHPEEGSTSSSFVRSGAPPAESLTSSRAIKQYEESKDPSSSMMRQFRNKQEGGELEHFLKDYSENDFNPLYVGSTLASQFRGAESTGCASQFLQDSSQCDEAGASMGQTGGVVPRSVRTRTSQGEGGGWHIQSEVLAGNEGNAIDVNDYKEMAKAAHLLQAMGRDYRAS